MPALTPQELELVFVDGRLEPGVEHLDRLDAVVARRDAVAAAEDDHGVVLLELDLALRGEAGAEERRAQSLAEPGLREEEVVVRGPAEDGQRRDDTRFRVEEQRLARVTRPERLDVVRHEGLEERLGVGAAHADEVAGARGHT